MLVLLNVSLIGLWVKLLMIPYKYLYPSAVFFVAIGVYSTNNDMFQVGETVVVGLTGYLLLLLDFHPASILLGFVLGPRVEENFRRSLLVSRGDAMIFVERPISAFFLFLCLTLLAAQVYVRLRKPKALAALDVADGNGVATARPRSELLVVQGPIASRTSKDERRSRQQELQAKKYFDECATREMTQNPHASKRTVQGSLAHPWRILAMRARSAGFLAERRSAGLSVTSPYDLVGCHAMGSLGSNCRIAS
ncbi:tripartite tricarboxylate transporter permease [Bradyrhizobium sp. 138]|uniref:tripartite tricarboxylate transporter permease n=1 Tax=Bradyrhizobium sp. 138 TaxID=2782615 RepID=UPI002097C398|nr:tripartite tricarboxylate transporter permease [Bradyrhizobium sp. 138]